MARARAGLARAFDGVSSFLREAVPALPDAALLVDLGRLTLIEIFGAVLVVDDGIDVEIFIEAFVVCATSPVSPNGFLLR